MIAEPMRVSFAFDPVSNSAEKDECREYEHHRNDLTYFGFERSLHWLVGTRDLMRCADGAAAESSLIGFVAPLQRAISSCMADGRSTFDLPIPVNGWTKIVLERMDSEIRTTQGTWSISVNANDLESGLWEFIQMVRAYLLRVCPAVGSDEVWGPWLNGTVDQWWDTHEAPQDKCLPTVQ
jgi:hypothetical protein